MTRTHRGAPATTPTPRHPSVPDPDSSDPVRQDAEAEQGDLLDLLDEQSDSKLPSGCHDADSNDDGPTLPERFDAFHEANPHIYEILVRLAREWVAKTGRRRVGIGMLWELVRWELSTPTTETPVVLNNDYRAPYARLIMANEPDLVDLFETRRSVTDEPSAGAA